MLIELGFVSEETKGIKPGVAFDPAQPSQPRNQLTFE